MNPNLFKLPLVSIIISNLNGEEWLKNCLSSLKEQDYPHIELILIDNGSEDKSIDFIKCSYPTVKIIENDHNLGYAMAGNQGAEQASGELLLFLNNDTEVKKDFLSILVQKILESPQIAACQPKIRFLQEKEKIDSVGSFPTLSGFLYHLGHLEKDQGQYDRLGDIFSPKGACVLIRKNVFEKMGGFDSDFFCYFEETDLAWRIWLGGYRITLASQAVIYHKMGATCEKMNFEFLQYHAHKNKICSFLKNLEVLQLIWFLPLHLVFYFLPTPIFLVTFKFKKIFTLLNALWWNISHLKETLRKRRIVQEKIRMLSDKDLFKNKIVPIPWRILFWNFLWLVRSR